MSFPLYLLTLSIKNWTVGKSGNEAGSFSPPLCKKGSGFEASRIFFLSQKLSNRELKAPVPLGTTSSLRWTPDARFIFSMAMGM